MQPNEHLTSDYIHLTSSQVKTQNISSTRNLPRALPKGNEQLSQKAICLCSWLSFTEVTSNASSFIKRLHNARLSVELGGTSSEPLKVSAEPGSTSLFAGKFSPLLNAEHPLHINVFCVLARENQRM